MKALSLKQPWANLIALGRKTIETRTWHTSYRGPLLICASKTVDYAVAPPFQRVLDISTIPRGCAIAVVDLVTCRPMTPDDEDAALCRSYFACWAWLFENVRPIEHFPLRGQLGLFEVDLPPSVHT